MNNLALIAGAVVLVALILIGVGWSRRGRGNPHK
jgi:FtsZ-interacting cell division protein ZipA